MSLYFLCLCLYCVHVSSVLFIIRKIMMMFEDHESTAGHWVTTTDWMEVLYVMQHISRLSLQFVFLVSREMQSLVEHISLPFVVVRADEVGWWDSGSTHERTTWQGMKLKTVGHIKLLVGNAQYVSQGISVKKRKEPEIFMKTSSKGHVVVYK